MMSEVSPGVRKMWVAQAAAEYSFCGLLTGEPAQFNNLAEASGGARQMITWSPIESQSLIRNANALIFDRLDWGQRISHVALFNSAGVMGFWGALEQPTVIERGTLSVADEIDDYTKLGVGTFKIEAFSLGIRVT